MELLIRKNDLWAILRVLIVIIWDIKQAAPLEAKRQKIQRVDFNKTPTNKKKETQPI